MTKTLAASEETSKNAFDFYNTYLSVIYGLLATQGLTSVVNFTSKDDEQAWNTLSILLFGGTFIAVMRLWFSLAKIDDLTRQAYRAVRQPVNPNERAVKHSRFNILLLVDVVFATTFAGLLLAMFSAIPSETFFFLLFVWLAGLILLYDLVSGLLFHWFTREGNRDADDQEIIARHKAKVSKWIKYDLLLVAAAIALYLLSAALHLGIPVALALTFVLITIVQLVGRLFPHWGEPIKKFLGRLRAHA